MSIELDRKSRATVAKIANLRELTKSGIEHAAYTSAVGLKKATSKEILRKPKSGRTYIRVDRIGRRRKHVASAPGETHANMTGALRRSIGFKVNTSQLEFGYGVESREPAPIYAGRLEFGDKGGNGLKARPSLSNGIRSERRNFQNNFEREIGKRLEGRDFEG